ncbi:MAG: TetR/AcrR family transcriptional regulator [Acidimicrobiia bacterium]|nr:TetR/AcrR family transcriptional regulator [Acidimicrobiia bacterium]MYC45269.1 TetR/AcrR family transcriptional regulator [Acidimicrobiia bacterium]MYI19454.1 TetR/AcrR family transcriptional regulator [Acidimicrobiia bacterium]
METRDRILEAALMSFGGRGYDAVSLDSIARDSGIRKQTVLYYFGSKDALMAAVIDQTVADLTAALLESVEAAPAATGGAEGPSDVWAGVEAVVRAVFRFAVRRPEMLGLLREVTRLGPPWMDRVRAGFEPLVERARAFLEAGMESGAIRRCDARLLLVSTYSTVMGVATEVEVLRAVGVEPTLRDTVIRRRELLRFLRSALVG